MFNCKIYVTLSNNLISELSKRNSASKQTIVTRCAHGDLHMY